MLSKKIYLQVIFRALIILLLCLFLSYCLFNEQYELAILGLVLLIFLIASLIYYTNQTNRKIALFFNSVQNEDFSLHFSEKMEAGSILELNKNLNEVNRKVQQLYLKNEQQEKFYQDILNRVDIGILLINEKEHIVFSNPASEKLLHHTPLTHVSQLNSVDSDLHHLFQALQETDRQLFELSSERESNQLIIKSSPVKVGTENLRLVTLQNIQQELDEKETDSWTKLISVLIHEIMNAIAPITSISDSMLGIQQQEENANPVFLKGLETIKNQGNDLMSFVQSYRSFLTVPKPDKSIVNAEDLCKKVQNLVLAVEGYSDIEFSIEGSEEKMELFVDEQQLTQVLLNLVKNAMEALKGVSNSSIQLSFGINEQGKKFLSVADNGKGIAPELMDQIFVPFFTSKDSGTGVGLSLSKRIIQQHGGSIKVKSKPLEETIFILEF